MPSRRCQVDIPSTANERAVDPTPLPPSAMWLAPDGRSPQRFPATGEAVRFMQWAYDEARPASQCGNWSLTWSFGWQARSRLVRHARKTSPTYPISTIGHTGLNGVLFSGQGLR